MPAVTTFNWSFDHQKQQKNVIQRVVMIFVNKRPFEGQIHERGEGQKRLGLKLKAGTSIIPHKPLFLIETTFSTEINLWYTNTTQDGVRSHENDERDNR